MTPAELKIVENKKEPLAFDPLLTPEQVAKWLNTSIDWVWGHSSRKPPLLPVRDALESFATGPARSRNLSRSRSGFPQSVTGTLAVE